MPEYGSGVLRSSQAWPRSPSYNPAVISLRKNPGATVLIRIECFAHWTASSAVRPVSPSLLAAYDACGIPGTPTCPLIDEMLTIDPPAHRGHVLEDFLGQPEWGHQVELQRLQDCVKRLVLGLVVGENVARHVHEYFRRPQRLGHLLHDPPGLVGVGQVAADGETIDHRRQRRQPLARRATTATRAPAAASAFERLSPSPDEPPVTMATRPSRLNNWNASGTDGGIGT